MPRLLSPEQAAAQLARRYARNHRAWLNGGTWPLTLPVGNPSEADARLHPDALRDWVNAWETWSGPGTLVWRERGWRTLGAQRLPRTLSLQSPEEVAAWAGELPRWERARARYEHLTERWPQLAAVLPRHFDALADYAAPDFERLEALLAWLERHPRSGLYPRQIPLAGLDSKWIELRRGMVTPLAAALLGAEAGAADFYQACGLRPPPELLRMRLLDETLRAAVGGLGELATPAEELARLRLPVQRVFIVENLQTGLAFDALPGTVVLMGLGYRVDVLAALPWLSEAPCHYWGDLDTHGFAILSRARTHLPWLQAFLMDEHTLLMHRALWTREPQPHATATLPHLTPAEDMLYRGLKEHRWAHHLRLEQERIAWDYAWQAIQRLASGA